MPGLFSLFQIAPASGGGNPTMGLLLQIAPFAVLIVVFYFLLIRPQSKKQKETEKMLKGMKKGDSVVTIGGVNGVISSVKENTVIVKVDDNCKIEFLRSAISSVNPSDSGEKADKSEKSEKDDAASAQK